MEFHGPSSVPPVPNQANFARYGAVILEDSVLPELGSWLQRELWPCLGQSVVRCAGYHYSCLKTCPTLRVGAATKLPVAFRPFSGVEFLRLWSSFLDDDSNGVEIFQILWKWMMTFVVSIEVLGMG